jgi:hypothetical protein
VFILISGAFSSSCNKINIISSSLSMVYEASSGTISRRNNNERRRKIVILCLHTNCQTPCMLYNCVRLSCNGAARGASSRQVSGIGAPELSSSIEGIEASTAVAAISPGGIGLRAVIGVLAGGEWLGHLLVAFACQSGTPTLQTYVM